MTILPSQKLTISQLYLGLAAGLMLFLLPNDAKNQIENEGFCNAYIVLISLVITGVLFFITKRYEAIGVSLMTMAALNTTFFIFDMIRGFSDDPAEYWPELNRYKIVSLFLLWFVPFVFCITLRLLASGGRDNNETRRDFSGFIASSMKALFIIYVIVVLFKLIMPDRPGTNNREIELMIFSRISSCLNGTHENGLEYICWHCIVLSPLAFYFAVLVPKFKIWHVAIISALLGVAVEIMQFILGTATACTDDVFMIMIGAVLGIAFKYIIDKLRSIITHGEDKNMLSFDYKHLLVKPKGEAQVLTED